MRILVVTTWFPTPGHPAVGAFVARDVAALATHHDVRVLHLVSPALADDGGPLTSGLPADDGGAARGSRGSGPSFSNAGHSRSRSAPRSSDSPLPAS